MPLSKPDLHTQRSSASFLNSQYPVDSLRSSSRCLRLLPRLPIASILASKFSSTTYFRKRFLRKLRPIQLASLLFIVCMTFLSFLNLFSTYFISDRSKWSTPPISSTIFQNFPGIYDLLSKLSKFQQHTNFVLKFVFLDTNPRGFPPTFTRAVTLTSCTPVSYSHGHRTTVVPFV